MLVKSTIRLTKLGASALALLSGTALSANAQAVNLVQLAALPTPAKSAHKARPDVEALRYYATRGEQERVQAEITRLQKLYPGWKQPENIFADQTDEEQKLWKLYAKGEVRKVNDEIVALRKDGYEPSPELVQKLDERERRGKIGTAFANKNWAKVVAEANANPGLLLGNDIELIWWVAEAYARLERPDDSLEAFAAAFSSSRTRDERKGTMQRAATLLSTKAALTLAQTHREVSTEDVLKGDIEDAIVRGALGRAAEVGEEPPAILNSRLESFSKRARTSGNYADATLLAWSHFGQSRWKQAYDWFKIAMAKGNDVKNIEGAIMSAKRSGDIGQAAQWAAQYHDKSTEIAALYININAPHLLKEKPASLSSEFLQGYADKTMLLNSGEGAEALGWYAYNVRHYEAARAWFGKAALWEETETAIYGQALTARATKDRAFFDEVKRQFSMKYTQVAKLRYADPVRRVKAARVVKRRSRKIDRAGRLRLKIAGVYKSKAYSSCLRLSRKLRQYGPLKAGDHQMRGWCLLGAKRAAEAERAFANARRLGGKGQVASSYGQALSALSNGKTNTALTIANNNRLTARQRKVIDIELLTQRARAAFNNRDYAASVLALNKRRKLTGESRDLSFMRAWAHYHVGDRGNAYSIFSMLDAQMSTRESRRGMAAVTLKNNKVRNPDT